MKKVPQTNGCALRAPKNLLNESERFIVIPCSRFIFYFPSVLLETIRKKSVLHFVYKLSIDIQYTHKYISNQMRKLKLQFYITCKSSTY